ncbi:MAG: hypothetical protein B7Y93_08415 [Micrococcales bacterium 32-70-13]|nr:MAG: hypothetical protein B7Y93_08415 [Micrococcales bacterium 32-70-13]
MSAEWISLLAGLLLTIGTGFFVASEFALVNLDRSELEARQARGEKRLGPTIAALKITSTHLSSAQLGITLTTLLTGFLMEPAISSMLADPLRSIGLPEGAVPVVGSIIAITVATLLSMIVGELVPKNFALSLPRQTAKVVVPFQWAFTTVFRPAIVVLNGSANAILRSMGVEPKEELSGARTAEELASLVRRSASEGRLDRDTATLLSRTLAFSQVIDESIDDIVGIVHVKQAVAVPRDRRAEVPASALQSEALRVPETMMLDTLLGELRGRGYQMAIVVDEYGGTAGVATLEDLVEELVGEVSDEHDRARVDVVRSRNWLTFPGILRPDELADRAGVTVPDDGPWETVGGYLMAELGRLPEVGDTVEIASGTFRIERLDGRRIDRVRFTPLATGEITLPSTATAGGESR